jgi:hypothetical protein
LSSYRLTETENHTYSHTHVCTKRQIECLKKRFGARVYHGPVQHGGDRSVSPLRRLSQWRPGELWQTGRFTLPILWQFFKFQVSPGSHRPQ